MTPLQQLENLIKDMAVLAAIKPHLTQQPGWMPIESAPKDGRDILMTDGETVAQVSWWVNEWMLNIGQNPCCHDTWASVCEPPSHWMPLPLPPTANGEL